MKDKRRKTRINGPMNEAPLKSEYRSVATEQAREHGNDSGGGELFAWYEITLRGGDV